MGLMGNLLGNKCASCGKRVKYDLLDYGVLKICKECNAEFEEQKRRREEEEARRRVEEEEARQKKAVEIAQQRAELAAKREREELPVAVQKGNVEAVREILQAFRANYPRRTFWPLRVESVPELPLLLNGKIDLVSLPALPNKTVHWFQRI